MMMSELALTIQRIFTAKPTTAVPCVLASQGAAIGTGSSQPGPDAIPDEEQNQATNQIRYHKISQLGSGIGFKL